LGLLRRPTAAIDKIGHHRATKHACKTCDMEYMLEELEELSGQIYDAIGQVRGKVCSLVQAGAGAARAACQWSKARLQSVGGTDWYAQGVIIGATTGRTRQEQTPFCFSPALIAQKDDIDQDHCGEWVGQLGVCLAANNQTA